MLGYFTLKSSFDTDGKYTFPHIVWVTEEQKANLLGIDFCKEFCKTLNFDIPALELKQHSNVICYGTHRSQKQFPNIAKIQKIEIPHSLYIDAKPSRLYKHRYSEPDKTFSIGTTFVPHRDLVTTGLKVLNTICTRSEKTLPIYLENTKNHMITINKGPIGHASTELSNAALPRLQVGDCQKFVDTIMSEHEILSNQFIFDAYSNTIAESNDHEVNEISTTTNNSVDTETMQYEFIPDHKELATDFTEEARSCQPDTSDIQFKIFRPKGTNRALLSQFRSEDAHFLKSFDFQYSDLNDTELIELMKILIEDSDVYSKHKYDIGKIKQKFHITLKPNTELRKQRVSKVSLHYKEKLDSLLEQLIKANIIREMGDDDELGSSFANPIILMPKNDYIKLVIDARYLNSVTDLTTYSWPLEPIQILITRINGVYFTVSDLSCAYHQVGLSKETQRLTSFIIGGKQYTYVRGFYGLCGLPNFFSRIMTLHFAPLIKKKQAITYLDDSIMQAQTKEEMFNIIKEYHALLRKAGLKAAPDKTMFFLRKVKFLGHVISEAGIQPVAKRVQDLKKLKSPENKRDVMRVLGCIGFYSNYIKNLHVDCKPFYDLIKEETTFSWTSEHEKLFDDIKSRISTDTILAIPSTKYPFHIHVDSSI